MTHTKTLWVAPARIHARMLSFVHTRSTGECAMAHMVVLLAHMPPPILITHA